MEGQGKEESGGSLGVHPPILLKVRTAQDELASPMLLLAFPVGGQGEVMLPPAFPVGGQGEVESGSSGNLRDNHLNVKKRFVPKPPRRKKGRLKKPKKSSYDYGSAQDTLGLHEQNTHVEVYSAARMTINNVRTNETPLVKSPTKDKVKEERDMLHSIATVFE